MIKKIAVDGTAGSGKSTISKIIAEKCNYTFISTGGFYRSYAYILLKANLVDSSKEEQIQELKKHTINIEGDIFYIDNVNVKNELRTEEISMLSSQIAQKEYIRNFAKHAQISFSKRHDKVIMDGRDIGTEIMPNADLKLYFFSSLYIRSKRRKKELFSIGVKTPFIKIYWDTFIRDWGDKHRKIAPLKIAKDAIKINTSKKSIDQVVKEVLKLIGN